MLGAPAVPGVAVLKSLRAQLTLFWLILLTVCVGLAMVMVLLFRHSAGLQIEQAQARAAASCGAIAQRYAKSLNDPQRAEPQLDLLQVLLQLVLVAEPHVEGGVWRAGQGFIAYAYPTYEGTSVKRDVPEAEQAHIAALSQVVARRQQADTDVVRASREALIVSACPLQSPGKDLAAWTMTRTSLATLDAQRSLRWGLGALLAFVLASGLWLGTIVLRGRRHLQRLHDQLAQADGSEAAPPISPTGLRELDALISGLNGYRARFEAARSQLREAERSRSRDQRLAALGRMTGGIAHEIRNPIAAMRLKAENALAGPPERQPQALQLILDQVGRLDGLVQSLLAVVQPLNLQLQPVGLADFGHQRLAAAQTQADQRGVKLALQVPEALCAQLDANHLARAIDNLLDNAVRHAPAGSTVQLTIAQAAGGLLTLAVRDHGPGVPAELQGQLFEPFATGRPDGTGLGLALAREVALAHGGELRHEAPADGGARFTMELPWRAC